MEFAARYVYKIYQEKSFSAAAKELFVSQPALSASVAKLEKTLGFRIFDRNTIPVSLTAQGRLYIEYLEEVLESERTLQEKLRKFSDISDGHLTVGGYSYTSQYLLPLICGTFHSRFPKTRLSIDLGNVGSVDNLMEKLERGTLDMLFSYHRQKEFENIPIFRERMVIAMRRDLPGAEALEPYSVTLDELRSSTYPPEKELKDCSIFRNIPFLDYKKPTSTGNIMKTLLGDYKTVNCDILNNRTSGFHYDSMCSGLGAVLTTDTLIKTHGEQDGILFFVPEDPLSHRTLYLVLAANKEKTPLENCFIEIAKEVCKGIEVK